MHVGAFSCLSAPLISLWQVGSTWAAPGSDIMQNGLHACWAVHRRQASCQIAVCAMQVGQHLGSKAQSLWPDLAVGQIPARHRASETGICNSSPLRLTDDIIPSDDSDTLLGGIGLTCSNMEQDDPSASALAGASLGGEAESLPELPGEVKAPAEAESDLLPPGHLLEQQGAERSDKRECAAACIAMLEAAHEESSVLVHAGTSCLRRLGQRC